MIDGADLLDQVDRRFVGLSSPTGLRAGAGGHPCQGLYWTPKGNLRPKTALIATHYNVDFAEHYSAPFFAARGFGFLGWNTRYRGAEDQFVLEQALIDIGAGVNWLKQNGAERIVILGNSGGGSLMGAYQGEAIAPTLEAKGVIAEALSALPKGDLYISLNAHKGRPEVLTDWMDASVTDEADPTKTDETLNPFNPEHGPPYAPAFITRYRAAQKARNQRITDWCKSELKRLNAAGYADKLFPMYRVWGDLRFMDPAIDPSDRKPQWCYAGHPAQANKFPSIGRVNTLRTWLSMWSLETSKCQGGPHLAKFTAPALVLQSSADTGVFPSDARAIFDAIGAKDKSLEFVPGAHYLEDSREVRDRAIDVMAHWIASKS